MAKRHPNAGTAKPSVDTGGPSNKHEGLFTGTAESRTDINLAAIPPNKPRPIETTPTSHLFGNFSD